MSLTWDEKQAVARRAAGSYAVLPRLQRIAVQHRKSRDPDDLIYLEFIQIASKGSISTKSVTRYEELQREISRLNPDPFGMAGYKRGEKPKKQRKCGICENPGHTARKCPNKTKKAIVNDDGIPRLAPGWDPSADVEDPTVFETEEPSGPDQPGW